MQSDRAGSGFAAAGVFIALALAPESLSMREIVFLSLAGIVLLATLAPILPLLHRLPKLGAPRVSVALSFEPNRDGAEDPQVVYVKGGSAEPRVLCIGFTNKGPRRVRGTLLNVLVPVQVGIMACDYDGSIDITHGKRMPPTVIDGRPMQFWAEKDVDFPVGSILLHYRLSFPDVLALGDSFPVRIQYDSDDLHGRERVYEQRVSVVDLMDTFQT